MASIDVSRLEEKFDRAQTKARALQERAGDDALQAATVEELQVALEELRVAQEEMRAQTAQLIEARGLVDAERRRYLDLFNFAPDAYLVTDANGVIRDANAAASNLLNVPIDWLPGRPLSVYVARPALYEFRRQINAMATAEGRQSLTLRVEPRGRDPFPAEVSVAATDERHNGTRSLLWMIRDVTERRRLEAQLVHSTAIERERIGRDLHDGLSSFAAVSMLLQALRRKLVDPAHVERADEIFGVLQDAIAETRRLSHDLCPAYLAHGDLCEGLEHIIRPLSSIPGLSVSLACPRPLALPDRQALDHLHRIAQEAVQNALRHGKATEIRLVVRSHRRDLEMSIRDNGVGMPDGAARREGMGLRLMRHRASLIGGALEVRPGERGGTVVLCHVPMSVPSPAEPDPGAAKDPHGES